MNPRGEGEDMMSCKTYALNIKVVKLVKLKAILENRKRNIYALGSGLQSFCHGAARACRGTGNDCQQAWEGQNSVGLHALHVQPDVHMCDWASPFQWARVASVKISREQEKWRERKKQSLLLIIKEEEKTKES